jgi:hypothetical protein
MLYILTLAEMKSELGLTDPVDDALLTQHAEALQGRFDDYLNRTLLRADGAAEIFDGGAEMLLVSRFPLEAVTSVHISAEQEWDADSLMDFDNGDYRWVAARGRIFYGETHGNLWPEGLQNIRVVYSGGYVAAGATVDAGQTAMPEALRGAFRQQLGYEWRNRKQLGQESVSAQGASISLAPAELLAVVKQALGPYRRL